jgi:hypothetical protein
MQRKRRQRPLPPIAGRTFSGIGELEAEINRIRREYTPLDTPVEGPDGVLLLCWMHHHQDFEDAALRHDGFRHLEIRRNLGVTVTNDFGDQNQIWLCFVDGYAEPFSYKAAKNNFGVVEDGFAAIRRRKQWITQAARCLVRDDVQERIQLHLETEGVCEISGTPLTRRNTEAHHAGVSFNSMLHTFLADYCTSFGVKPQEIEVVDTDTIGGKAFGNDGLNEAWVQYHCENAVIQILDGKTHREQHAGMTKPDWVSLLSA